MVQISSESARQLLRAVDLLYEAACEPGKWHGFLQSASELFEAQGAQIGHHDLQRHALSFSRVYGFDWDAAHYERYDALMPRDPHLPYFSQSPFQAVHCRMHLSDAELHASEVYKQVLRPGGVEYSLGVNLVEEARSLSYFLALRGPTERRFDSADCARLDQLMPHLNRALRLQRDFGAIDFERNIAVDSLDSMAVGIVIVDLQGHIKFSNVTAQEVLAEQDGLWISHGQVRAAHGDQAGLMASLRRTLFQARTGHEAPGELVMVPRALGRPSLPVMISPIWGKHLQSGWHTQRDPLAVLILRDPKRPRESRNEVLCRMYGLTNQQARVACSIVDGHSVREAGQEAGISEDSARKYLKIVFEKMGVRRQGELVAKVLNLPMPLSDFGH